MTVRADDPTDPEVISWARGFQQRVLERHGFAGATPSCEQAQICPAVSLTDFFGGGSAQQTSSTQAARAAAASAPCSRRSPCFISQIVISHAAGTPRRRRRSATPPTSPSGSGCSRSTDQQDLIDDIRAQIDPPGRPGPPAGTTVELAGLPVIAAEANTDLSHSRWWLPLVGMLAVGLVLALVYRSARRALVPADPGAARDRLVGAGRRRARRVPEPDVGDPRRARDRDRDRVQRDPLGPLRARARRAASRSARRSAGPICAPARRCSPRA